MHLPTWTFHAPPYADLPMTPRRTFPRRYELAHEALHLLSSPFISLCACRYELAHEALDGSLALVTFERSERGEGKGSVRLSEVFEVSVEKSSKKGSLRPGYGKKWAAKGCFLSLE